MLVASCTCGESKCGAVLITESTAVMTNDITEVTRGYFDELTSLLMTTIYKMMKQK